MFEAKEKLSEERNFEKHAKLEVEGDYHGIVEGVRFAPKDNKYANRYFIDFRIVATPVGQEHLIGQLGGWAQFMRPRYENIRTKTGGTFTALQQQEADEEKVQVAYAATLGLERNDAGLLAPNQKFAGALECAFFKKGNAHENEHVGRPVTYRLKLNEKRFDSGEVKVYKDGFLLPGHVGRASTSAGPVASKPASAAPAAPPPPPAPAAPVSFESRAAKEGYILPETWPGDCGYLYKPATGETVAVTELKARFGF